jgi:hypothetical protein
MQLPLVMPAHFSGWLASGGDRRDCDLALRSGQNLGLGAGGCCCLTGITQAGRYDKIWAGTITVLAWPLNGGLLFLEWVSRPGNQVNLNGEAAVSIGALTIVSGRNGPFSHEGPVAQWEWPY